MNIQRRCGGVLYWIGLVLLAVLMAEGMTCTLSIDPYFTADPYIDARGTLYRLMIYCIRSFSVNVETSSLLALGAGALLYFLPRLHATASERALAAAFGVLFSAAQLIGWSYANCLSWDACFGSHFTQLRFVIALAGRSLLFACLILYAFRLTDRWTAGSPGRFSRKQFALATGAVVLCWLPYYIAFFPGLGSPDTSTQIAWFMHYPTEGLQFSAVRGPDIYATNANPYFTTLLFGSFAKLGITLGNIRYGIAVYCLLQMILTALAVAGVWFYLRSIGLNRLIFRTGLVFTALFPLYPLYAITMLKDSLFCLACLVYSALLFEMVRSKGERLREKRFCIALFFSAALMMLSKNQGVYFAAAAAAPALVIFRRQWRQVIAALLLPVILFATVWIQVLLPAWNVAPGGKQELLGLLFQQSARYVSTYPEEVTAEEASAIRAVLDYDHLPELYKPHLADPVKFTYNQDATAEEQSAYYRAWYQMLCKHPDIYLQAWIHNFYASFYVRHETALSYTDFDNREGDNYPDIYVEKSPLLQRVQPIAQTLLQAAQHVPGIGLLFSIGFYPWVILFVLLDTLRRRRYEWILPQLPAHLSVLLLLFLPVSGSYRYAMPMFYLIPFLLPVCLLPDKAPKQQK